MFAVWSDGEDDPIAYFRDRNDAEEWADGRWFQSYVIAPVQIARLHHAGEFQIQPLSDDD